MHHRLVAAAVVLLAASPAVAASAFDGTWKADPTTIDAAKKPNVVVLQDGVYTCSTCVPAYSVKADGAFHPAAGNPYRDEVAVRVVDDRTIVLTTRKGGRPMYRSTDTVSPDGATLTYDFTDTTAPSGVAVPGRQVVRRAAAGPAGSHAISGSWLDTADVAIADAGMTMTLRSNGEALTFATPTGVGFTATIGGPRAPVTGDVGWDGVTLARTAPDTLVETDYQGAKRIGTSTYVVSADGHTIRATSSDLVHGTTQAVTMVRQ